ncbi:MAG: hypothetical protein ACREHV_14060 [Rhizomicrobium sp.]
MRKPPSGAPDPNFALTKHPANPLNPEEPAGTGNCRQVRARGIGRPETVRIANWCYFCAFHLRAAQAK